MEKKEYPIMNIVNWYIGNYCARKCFDNLEKLADHRKKLRVFAEKNKTLKITHKEFLKLFNDHMTICTLDGTFKRKVIFWKAFVDLQNTPNYDSDKIILKGKKLERVDEPLENPVEKCLICRKLSVYLYERP